MAPTRAAGAATHNQANAQGHAQGQGHHFAAPDGFRIGPIETRHRADWEKLYAGYAEFYQVKQTAEMRLRVWNWLHDPGHEVEGLICETEHGHAVGILHFRRFARPLSASMGGFVDDVFVDAVHRGRGLGAAMIKAVGELGQRRGWSVIRWITAENNYRARAMYDEIAGKTHWLTYDMKPGA
ncbi:MAG: GNAT family N-acetyltransferase [Alphaproteobacteria bacterium]|nr:GNAT family N-acetyltransferase [Alphaproteobacteria bacterium]